MLFANQYTVFSCSANRIRNIVNRKATLIFRILNLFLITRVARNKFAAPGLHLPLNSEPFLWENLPTSDRRLGVQQYNAANITNTTANRANVQEPITRYRRRRALASWNVCVGRRRWVYRCRCVCRWA